MSASPTLPNPADRATQRDEDAQYYRGILHELVEMATDIARVVHRQAIAGGDPPEGQRAKRVEDAELSAAPTPGAAAQPQPSQPAPVLTVAFDRLARPIRRTIALARKLSEPDRAPPGSKPHPTGRLLEHCAEGCTECCPSVRQRRTDLAETDALHAEPCERPEAADFDADEDLDDDLDEQSLAYLIATLRHDNGLATLTDAQLPQRCTAQSAQAGTPGKNCAPCARGAGPTATQPSTADPRLPTPPPRAGTGPPRH